jgi:pSer/pThr/pTyr-binding forkhead associated (FHA) protein
MKFSCEHCKQNITVTNPENIKPTTTVPCPYPTCKKVTRLIVTPIADSDKTEIEQPSAPPPPAAPQEVGWLIVHDENAAKQTFALQVGSNTVGRKGSKPADILIVTNDLYMSRNHCSVTVVLQKDATLSYILQDIGSQNSTYVNQTKLQASDIVYLNDGDTIQIGHTKVVIKTVTRTPNQHAAEHAVGKQSFGKTIIA